MGLKIPRDLEALQTTLSRIEQGEVTALEAIEALLGEEYTTRESRRIKMAPLLSKKICSTDQTSKASISPTLGAFRLIPHRPFAYEHITANTSKKSRGMAQVRAALGDSVPLGILVSSHGYSQHCAALERMARMVGGAWQ